MPPNANFQCEGWTIASEGTVIVLAKHTSARLNTTVLYEDIANTLDGGEKPTAGQLKDSVLEVWQEWRAGCANLQRDE